MAICLLSICSHIDPVDFRDAGLIFNLNKNNKYSFKTVIHMAVTGTGSHTKWKFTNAN